MTVAAGQILDRYKLVRKAGSGGMAEVWEAFDEGLDRSVAVKIMTGDLSDSEYVKRFFREAKIVARMDHPNILPVFDVGEIEGRPYLVMPFVSNGSLRDRMHDPVPTDDAILWLGQAAAGLDHAHKNGILHRDIKPANLLFNKNAVLCLADFGLARASEQSHAITVPGVVMGTPSYISPDQIVSDDVTPAADQYSLAVVAFELLTGKLPFSAPSSFLLLNKHVNEAPAKATSCKPDLPSGVDGVFERALAKKPERRFPSCSDFVNALSDALQPATKKLPRPSFAEDEEDGEGGTLRVDIPGMPARTAPAPRLPRPSEVSKPTVITAPFPRPHSQAQTEPAPRPQPAQRPPQPPPEPTQASVPLPQPAPSRSKLPWVLVFLLLAFIAGRFVWFRTRLGIPLLPLKQEGPAPAPVETPVPVLGLPASAEPGPASPPAATEAPASPGTPPVEMAASPTSTAGEPPARIVELAPTAAPPIDTRPSEPRPAPSASVVTALKTLSPRNLESSRISALRQTKTLAGQTSVSISWKTTLTFASPLTETVPEPQVVSAWLTGPAGKKALFAPGTVGRVQSGGPGQRELVLLFDGEKATASLEPGFDTVEFRLRLGEAEFEVSGELRSR